MRIDIRHIYGISTSTLRDRGARGGGPGAVGPGTVGRGRSAGGAVGRATTATPVDFWARPHPLPYRLGRTRHANCRGVLNRRGSRSL